VHQLVTAKRKIEITDKGIIKAIENPESSSNKHAKIPKISTAAETNPKIRENIPIPKIKCLILILLLQ